MRDGNCDACRRQNEPGVKSCHVLVWYSESFSCLVSIKPPNVHGTNHLQTLSDIIDRKESFKEKERERERKKKTPQMVRQKISRLQRPLTSCLPSLAIFHNSIRETISLVVLLQSDALSAWKGCMFTQMLKRNISQYKNDLDLYINWSTCE